MSLVGERFKELIFVVSVISRVMIVLVDVVNVGNRFAGSVGRSLVLLAGRFYAEIVRRFVWVAGRLFVKII